MTGGRKWAKPWPRTRAPSAAKSRHVPMYTLASAFRRPPASHAPRPRPPTHLAPSLSLSISLCLFLSHTHTHTLDRTSCKREICLRAAATRRRVKEGGRGRGSVLGHHPRESPGTLSLSLSLSLYLRIEDYRCRAKMEHVRQSRPDSSLSFKANVLRLLECVPSVLGSDWDRGAAGRLPETAVSSGKTAGDYHEQRGDCWRLL